MEPTDEEVVQAAAEAAESRVFEAYSTSEVRDLDVTVTFEEGILEVDVYLNVDDDEAERVAEEAVAAAERAVDELFSG